MSQVPRAYPGLAKVQHYVPKCLLRGFAAGKSDKVWVFDKQSERAPFITAVKNVAAEQGFYNLPIKDGITTLEPSLARLEDRVAGVLTRIRREESLAFLTAEDRTILAVFAIVQMERTLGHRLRIADLAAQMSRRMREMGSQFGIPEHHLDEQMPGARKLSESEVKALTIEMIADAPSLAPHLTGKSLVLARASGHDRFFISDNPLALFNMKDHGWRGNLGLAVEGIEIYLPISDRLLLWWVCPSYEEWFRNNLKSAKIAFPNQPSEVQAETAKLLVGNQRFLDAVDNGTALDFIHDTVIHCNSLQVRHGERFIFSSTNDFALVRDMISKDPKFRKGLRGVVS